MPTDPIARYLKTIDDAGEIFIGDTVTEPTVDKAWFGCLLVEVDEPHPTSSIPVLTAPRTKFFNNVLASSEISDRRSWSNEFMANALSGAAAILIGLAQTFNIPPDVLQLTIKTAIDSAAGQDMRLN